MDEAYKAINHVDAHAVHESAKEKFAGARKEMNKIIAKFEADFEDVVAKME